MRSILREDRRESYRFIAKVWLPVAIYAVLHDQGIVRIEPRHFTEYHRPLWGIAAPEGLAAAHAFLASLGPGVLLGVGCLLAGRAGSWPRIADRFVIIGVGLVLLGAEAASQLAGWWVCRSGASFYPDFLFPESSLGILTTQTMQVTCYLASAVFSGLLLGAIVLRRHRLNTAATCSPAD